MIVLSAPRRYWVKVVILLPSTRIAGFYEEQSFDIAFEALPYELAMTFHEVAAGLQGWDLETHRAVTLATAAQDWRGVVDETGAAVPFSTKAFMEVLGHPGVLASVARAYREELRGRSG